MSTKVITFSHKGDFKKTSNFLKEIKAFRIRHILEEYGKIGVDRLKANTPKRTGKTASSWSYKVVVTEDRIALEWHNDAKGSDNRTPIIILIQMGHGTRNGGYVAPIDVVNPVMQPLFEELDAKITKVVNGW